MGFFKKVSISVSIILLVLSCGSSDSPAPPPEFKPIPVNISFSASSEQVPTDAGDVTLKWSALTATYCEASGDWSGQKDTVGTEVITFTTTGDRTFTLNCRNRTSSSEESLNVYYFVPADGYLVDGYIEGASCVQSSSLEYDESSRIVSLTDSFGYFKVEDGQANVICKDGIDNSTGKDLTGLILSNNLENKDVNNFFVTPLSTLVLNVESQGNSNPEELAKNALGIDSEININEKDPFSEREFSKENKFYFEKNAQSAVLALGLSKVFSHSSTNEAFDGIAKILIEEFQSSSQERAINIENKAFIEKVMKYINNSMELSEVQNKALNMLSTTLPIISVKNTENNTNAVVGFATNTLLKDIADLINNNLADDIFNNYSDAESLVDYIAAEEGVSDGDELLPDITAADDTLAINEDEEGSLNPLLNDDYNVNEPFSIVFSEPSENLSIVAGNNGIYNVMPAANYFGTEIVTYTLTQGDLSDTAQVTILVKAVNDAPTLIKPIISVAENSSDSVTVLQDVDNEEIESSLSGDDSSFFEITNKSIKPKNSLDYDSPQDKDGNNQYSVILSFSDGLAEVSSENLTVKLTNLNDNFPVIGTTSFNVAENQTTVGSVSATDADGDTLTYKVIGDDDSWFEISSSGVLTFTRLPDYEYKETYNIVLQVSDGSNTTNQAVVVTVYNLNDNAPVIGTTSFSISENSTAVGSVSGSDADGDTLSYTVIGDDDSWFAISTSGVLSFTTAPDYEYKETYNIIVRVTDGKYTTDQAIVVRVTNINDNAPSIGTTVFRVTENQLAIGNISATDADGDALTSFSVSGDDAATVAISSDGVLSFTTAPDYETKTSYSLTVSVSDGAYTTSETVIITITNDTSDDSVTGFRLPDSVQLVETQEESE